MAAPNDLVKRLVLGRALRSDRLGEQLLPKKIALPVFASDALSSVAYAPDEIFLTLALAGVAAYTFSWKIALVVAVVMLTVIISYRQNVHAYPSGGGDYEVATVNLGATAGLTVASALLVDYVLTVAVSISSAAQYAASAIPALDGHEATGAVFATVFLMTMNLRGVKESGRGLRGPDLRLHGRDPRHDGVRAAALRLRGPAAAESADLAIAARAARTSRASAGWPAPSCCCGRSPAAAPRSPAWRPSATASRPSPSPRARTPRPPSACSA